MEAWNKIQNENNVEMGIDKFRSQLQLKPWISLGLISSIHRWDLWKQRLVKTNAGIIEEFIDIETNLID